MDSSRNPYSVLSPHPNYVHPQKLKKRIIPFVCCAKMLRSGVGYPGKGAGLCHSDLSVINGSRPRQTPMVLGHEASGIVREVGTGVRGLKPDDHVIFTFIHSCAYCRYCKEGKPSLCEPGAESNNSCVLMNGAQRFSNKGRSYFHHCGVSGYSQYTIALPGSLVKIDSTLPFEYATLFGCAVMTGTGAAMNTANIRPNQTVAVFGLLSSDISRNPYNV